MLLEVPENKIREYLEYYLIDGKCFKYDVIHLLGSVRVPMELIEDYKDLFSLEAWAVISMNQHIPENYLEVFEEYLDWGFIYYHQRLSRDNAIRYLPIFRDTVVDPDWWIERCGHFSEDLKTELLTYLKLMG